MRKRVIAAALLAGVCSLGVAACGGSDDDGDTSTAAPAATSEAAPATTEAPAASTEAVIVSRTRVGRDLVELSSEAKEKLRSAT